VELAQFADLPAQAQLRQDLRLPADRLIFCYVGKYTTMGEGKGVEGLVRAFAMLLQTHPDAFLYLAGLEEPEQRLLRALCRDLHIKESNYQMIALDQKRFAQYLMAADVLLMNYPKTEHYEKFMSPTKLFAYLAAGKPVVSTRLESITAHITHGVVFADDFTVGAYAAAMVRAATEFRSLQAQAQKNPIKATQYSWLERAKIITRWFS
jgi:glycosyltransferase involved in cell wall biosynthesis